jgi:hypothetical protein
MTDTTKKQDGFHLWAPRKSVELLARNQQPAIACDFATDRGVRLYG